MTIDTTLPASDPLRFRKICSNLYKNDITDELKILDDKIKVNQGQYDLGRDAAKISALSSKNLFEKYKYLLVKIFQVCLKKLNLSILHRVCHLVNHFKKILLKIFRIERVILIITLTINFTNFTKRIMNLKRCH